MSVHLFLIKKIRRACLRGMFWPALLLAASAAVLICLPRTNVLSPRPLNSKSRFENFYNPDLPYVSLTVPELSYSGYACPAKGPAQGYLYYTLNDGVCQFYLLSAAGQEPAARLTDCDLTGRLIRLDSETYSGLLTGLAADLDWSAASLEAIASPYAVSQLPAPIFFPVFLRLIALAALLSALAELFCLTFWQLAPARIPVLGTARAAEKKCPDAGSGPLKVLAAGSDLWLTGDFLLVTPPGRPRILPLCALIWGYSQRRILHLFGHPVPLPPTLHFLTADGRRLTLCQRAGTDPAKILAAIRRQNPAFLCGYSEKNKAAARQLLREASRGILR